MPKVTFKWVWIKTYGFMNKENMKKKKKLKKDGLVGVQ